MTVLREKMDYITLLSDVVLPVLHEVLQRYQWVFHYWHHIFRGPGLHGDQYNPCVELFLIDLRTTKCPSVHCFIWCFGVIFCKCHLGQIIPTHTHVFIDRWRSEKAEFSSRRINFLQTDHLPYPPCWPQLWQSSWFGCLSDAAVQTVEEKMHRWLKRWITSALLHTNTQSDM